MKYPAAPVGGISAPLQQATGYQTETIITQQAKGNLTRQILQPYCNLRNLWIKNSKSQLLHVRWDCLSISNQNRLLGLV